MRRSHEEININTHIRDVFVVYTVIIFSIIFGHNMDSFVRGEWMIWKWEASSDLRVYLRIYHSPVCRKEKRNELYTLVKTTVQTPRTNSYDLKYQRGKSLRLCFLILQLSNNIFGPRYFPSLFDTMRRVNRNFAPGTIN